ncbi:MAG: amidohydrolase family protein [Geminicoccaceae bacterium]|nr:amidohydrolase family protein [Geminicoccaceae bacterium]
MAVEEIVDTHVHLYDPVRLPYGWMRGDPILDRRHGLSEFEAATGGLAVAQLVFVEVAVDPGHHLAEAEAVQRLAERDPRLAAIVARAPVERGAAVEEDLDRLERLPALRGIRRLVQDEPDPDFCVQPDFVEGVRRVGARGLVFELCLKSARGQLARAIELVRRCPEVRFVLDHLGKPPVAEGAFEPWKSQLRELSRAPNVVCKISGLITEADPRRWTRSQLRPWIEHAIACFGFERVMFGSDWPVSARTHRYATWVAILDELLASCSADERARFWGGTAREVYRLARTGEPTARHPDTRA